MASRPFLKIHDKFIIIPVADYATLYSVYKKTLMGHQAIDRNFQVSCLAKLLVGLPLEFAEEILAKIAGIGRRMLYKKRPLHQSEALEALFNCPGIPSKEDLEALDKFWGQLPLEKKRREIEEEERLKKEQEDQLKKKK